MLCFDGVKLKGFPVTFAELVMLHASINDGKGNERLLFFVSGPTLWKKGVM